MGNKQVETLTGVICILLSGVLAIYITTRPWHTPGADIMAHSSFFPLVITGGVAAMGVWQCLWGMSRAATPGLVTINKKGILLLLGAAACTAAMPYLGFLISYVAFLFFAMWLWGERRRSLLLPVSLGLPLLIYIVLGKILHVTYPSGLIPF